MIAVFGIMAFIGLLLIGCGAVSLYLAGAYHKKSKNHDTALGSGLIICGSGLIYIGVTGVSI